MATNAVDVCNQALNLAGDIGSITSLTQATRPAEVAASNYADTKKTLLSRVDWVCAQRWFRLNRDTDTPLFGWSYQYSLPFDFIRIVEIDGNPPYQQVGNKLFCNEADVLCLYLADISEPLMRPYIVKVLREQMASIFCMGVKADKDDAAYWQSEANASLIQAMFFNDNENPPQKPLMNEISSQRRNGGVIL